ncbi:FecR family protein [Portibacter lacus]|uniref:Iron dicitrate transporter FecR n=1 Tax=Portibacter lacus TaxID=1099794 RepID=A0AA37SYA6_9BACT|nr:FecR domain-containing protein [Portibacter lacus]GLR19788.1 iron dicitrate transporter FecR [Portibacter lacus]
MSYSDNKYDNYAIEDWVIDDDFISYVNGEHDSTLIDSLKLDPKHSENIQESTKIIQNLSADTITIEDQKLDGIFNRINETIDSTAEEPKAKTKIKSMRWVGVAAAIVTLFVIAFPFIFKSENSHVTTIAEQDSFKLPDSSVVELNSVSTLKYNERSWEKSRFLVLEGEAFFKVKKGSKFTVKSPQGVVSVLGTQFNITDRIGFYEVECLEGKVQVSIKLQDSYILNKGDRFILKDNQEPVIEKNVVKKIDWLDKFVNFDNQNLSYVLDEVGRHFDVKFENVDALLDKKYTGFFTTVSIDSAMQQIFWPMDVNYEIKGKKVIVK